MNLWYIRRTRTPAGGGRRRWLWPCLAAGSVLLSGAAMWPLLSGRTEPPLYTLESARRAITQARKSGAAKWAPDALIRAEAAYRQSLLENRIQEVKLLLFRDFTRVRLALGLAEAKALRASEEAEKRRQEARAEAEASLEEAERLVALAGEVADVMHLGIYDRSLLQRARTTLAEAAILHENGAHRLAAERAQNAGEGAAQVSSRAAQAASRFTDAGLVGKWRRMVADTVSWSRSRGARAIVVVKDRHSLTLYDDGRPVKTYRAELGYRSISHKTRAGDAATPEGRYRIVSRKARSTYYKALVLDYPNAEDRARFERLRRKGEIPRWAKPGGLIEVHGDGGRGKDWTRGCVALRNGDMDDLFRRVEAGTPVTIVGSDGEAGGIFTEIVRRHRAANGAKVR